MQLGNSGGLLVIDVVLVADAFGGGLVAPGHEGAADGTLGEVCKHGKGACERGKRGLPAGRKMPSDSLRPCARMNKGGRPYSCGRPPFYIGADGRISFLFLVLVFLWG